MALASVEALPPGPPFDPADPGFMADPYPAYARVREATAVWHPAGDHLWYLTRFADVHAGFRDRRLGTTFLHRYTPEELGLAPDIPVWRDPRWQDFQAFERWELLNLEPPLHTRLRRLVTEAFTPRTIEGLRPTTEGLARSLLEPGRAAGSIDLVRDYAQHLSLGIICGLIGVPASDESTILGWSDETIRMYEPAPSEAQRAASDAAAGSFRRYLLDLIAHRRRRPSDDLLSALLDARVDEERLSDDQIASTAMVLLMAGHEAAVNATANGIAALAAHPDQWRLVRRGEVPPRSAIEEVLRFDPPLQWFERWVLDDGVRGRRRGHPARLARRAGAGCRQPRPAATPRPRPVRPAPGRYDPPVARRRHPLLHRGAAGAAGARDHAERARPHRARADGPAAAPSAARPSSSAATTGWSSRCRRRRRWTRPGSSWSAAR